jgi:hypothetical protein
MLNTGRLRRSAAMLLGIVLALHLHVETRTGLPRVVEEAIAAVTLAELRAHVQTLASDEMAGRGLGQPGNQRAERYIAEALGRAGVPAAADEAHLQPVELYRPTLGKDGRLDVTVDGETIAALRTGPQFYPLPASMAQPVNGAARFLGHGISAPRLGHDDYSRIDARGAIVFALEGAPRALIKAGSKAADGDGDLTGLERKVADATAHGAAGLVVIYSMLPDSRGTWAETGSGSDASYRIYPRRPRRPGESGGQPGPAVAAISADAAAPIRTAVGAARPVQVSLVPGVVVEPITVHNVVGLIDGRSRQAREMVVVGAHLDHEGVDAGGTIYNGADDNASGTSAVLAMAAAFARAAAAGERPERAVLFALWNGEEQGSLGAEAFAQAPRPDFKVVANINLDMVGRDEDADPKDVRFHGFPRRTPSESDNLLHVLGYTRSPALARLVRSANQSVGLDLRMEYDEKAQNLLQRSDHWPFLRRGIPAIFLTTGLHPDYHEPSDDADRVDYGKLERITELAARFAWLAAGAQP